MSHNAINWTKAQNGTHTHNGRIFISCSCLGQFQTLMNRKTVFSCKPPKKKTFTSSSAVIVFDGKVRTHINSFERIEVEFRISKRSESNFNASRHHFFNRVVCMLKGIRRVRKIHKPKKIHMKKRRKIQKKNLWEKWR